MSELIDSLLRCEAIVIAMCNEGRPPKMSVPVQSDDEDTFMVTTIEKAISSIGSQQRDLDAARARIKELEDRLFAIGEMRNAPCFCCGYNGHDYFNPEVHACAARHHAALSAKGE